MKQNMHFLIVGAVIGVLVLTAAAPAEAQREFEPLFDKFNFKLEGSWVALKTEIRLDSDIFEGPGTTLSFENDLGLPDSEAVPTLAFEWQIARKHRLALRWQELSRDSSAQALTEIQWGNEIIPVDANITLAFENSQYFIDYTYYPWVKDRWAFGFGLGLRWMDIQATLAYSDATNDIEGQSDVKGSAPLPYLYFEYRRLLSDKWRFITGLGWLYIKIEDLEGGQWIGRASIEYLAGKRWSFGAAFNLSNIDIDWNAISTEEATVLNLALDMGINDFSVFARVRF